MQKKIDTFVKIIFMVFIIMLGYGIVSLAGYLYYTRPQLEEDSLQGYIDWADRLADYGDFDTAVEAAEGVISTDPQNAQAYVFLANVYLKNRDIESAKNIYESAVSQVGENKLITDGLAAIANIDVATDPAKSETSTKTKEDSLKYALTYEYNANGDLVRAYSRSHDWERPDLESLYEYNSDNQLVRVVEINSFILPNYITYDYHSNGQVNNETRCDYNGYVLERSIYDEAAVKTNYQAYYQDRSWYMESLDADGYVYKKEFYDADNRLMYYAEHEMAEAEDYDEKTVYYNPDNTVKYTLLHKYSSSVKSVERETYYDGNGNVVLLVDHGDDNHYHIYTGADAESKDGSEYQSFKFYADADEFVCQELGILK